MLDPSRDSLADLILFLTFPIAIIGCVTWMLLL